MWKLTRDTKIPSVQSVVDILTAKTENLGIPVDFDRMEEYYAYYSILSNEYLKRIIEYTHSNKNYQDYKDVDFMQFLKRAGVKTGLLETDGGRYSLSGESLESAIATGLYSEELCKLMSLYSKVKSYKSIISPFPKIMQGYKICPLETFDNHRMIILKPTWVSQITGRIGAQNPAIMNFEKGIQDIFTVPKGWIKCEADSGQVDPRIAQSYFIDDKQLKACTMLYNDAYFGYIHFCEYLTDEQRKTGDLNLKPFEITDALKEKRKKLKTFGNAVMYGSTENRLNDPDKAAFIKYVGNHPQRLAKVRNLEDRISRGQTKFYTYFGTEMDITQGPGAQKDCEYSAEEQLNRKVKRAINYPIQGTAADLMRYSIYKANQLLMREAPDSTILMYVHDSGKFMIAEHDYDKVIDVIREVTSYQVDDWIPIYSDYEEGIHKSDVKRFIA